ncbi:hypothetical protein WN944_027018 [Citrus x changshan-huyou]|uniref:Uncharacterized protein n=1 Tax=Citrus x changshan-huyou TaxID=2935761 RepID=A0AAP0LL35_9ROSI
MSAVVSDNTSMGVPLSHLCVLMDKVAGRHRRYPSLGRVFRVHLSGRCLRWKDILHKSLGKRVPSSAKGTTGLARRSFMGAMKGYLGECPMDTDLSHNPSPTLVDQLGIGDVGGMRRKSRPA